MISLVVGFPGSGKSYYAINKIYNILTNNDKMCKDIEVIYTNINGVKFDYFPNSKILFKKFNDSEFYTYLMELHILYEINKNDDSVDDKLIELTKTKGYYKALIVFDECHEFFCNQDKYKIFWLTYHRHLYHEIILLTQNKTLIHSKYRAIPEIFIEAQPRSKKIFNNSLSYKKYASFAMRKTDLFGKDILKTNQEVFNLYQSGNKSNQKSIISKYIKLIFIFVLIVFFAFYYILNSFSDDSSSLSVDNTNSIPPIIPKIAHERINESLSNSFVVVFMCAKNNSCIYLDNSYSYAHIKMFISETSSKIVYRDFLYKSKNHSNYVFNLYVNTNTKNINNYFLVDRDNKDFNKVKSFNNDIPVLENITSKVSL
jgi:zona occludens toxin